MKHIKKLKIDIDKNNFEVIPSVQYDSNTRFLHIQLLDGAVPLDITGCSVILSGIKQDGKSIFNSCDIINSKIGFIEAEVTEQMNVIVGDINCEVKIYDGNGVLTTKKFTINVTASNTSKEIESTGEFKALTKALNEVQNIDNKFSEVNSQLEQKANEVDLIVERERINNLIAHNNDTEGNSELIDGRTDFIGVTHNNLGKAIREQFQIINGTFSNIASISIDDGFNGKIIRTNISLLKHQIAKITLIDTEGCINSTHSFQGGIIIEGEKQISNLFTSKTNVPTEFVITQDCRAIVIWIPAEAKIKNGTLQLKIEHLNTLNERILLNTMKTKENTNTLDTINKLLCDSSEYYNDFTEYSQKLTINSTTNTNAEFKLNIKKGTEISVYVDDIENCLNERFVLNIGVGNSSFYCANIETITNKNNEFSFIAPLDIEYIKVWCAKEHSSKSGTFNLVFKNKYGIISKINQHTLDIQSLDIGVNGLSFDNKIRYYETDIDINKLSDVDSTIAFATEENETISVIVLGNGVLREGASAYFGIKYLSGEVSGAFNTKIETVKSYKLKNEKSNGLRVWIPKSDFLSEGTIKLRICSSDGVGLKDKINSEIEKLNSKIDSLQKEKKTFGSFSIVGDSYSTYKNWIPNGYATWYADEGNSQENNVESVKDTWWWLLSNETKLKLLTNSSYSGSTICNTGYSGADSTSTSFITRVKKDLGEGKVLQEKPNIIFIFGATNDSWANAPIGSLKYSNWSNYDLKSVLPSFCYLIDYLKLWNPHARIINIVNTGLKNEIVVGMKTACDYYEIENLVLVDIEKENGHPNKNGMESIKNQILDIL